LAAVTFIAFLVPFERWQVPLRRRSARVLVFVQAKEWVTANSVGMPCRLFVVRHRRGATLL